jgi:hypothetical protein
VVAETCIVITDNKTQNFGFPSGSFPDKFLTNHAHSSEPARFVTGHDFSRANKANQFNGL